jgi:hypothetical protein
MTPPLRTPTSPASPQSTYLIPLLFPRRFSSAPRPRVFIYDNSTSLALGHTSFLIRARAFSPHSPTPSDAPPVLSIGTPDNERYLAVIRSAATDLTVFLLGILHSANPREVHSSPASFAKFFLYRRYPLPTFSHTHVQSLRIYYPSPISLDQLTTDLRRFKRIFPSSVIEFASDRWIMASMDDGAELEKESREGRVRSWDGEEREVFGS